MSASRSIQDHMPNNPCFGCGAENPHGHKIKSYWREGRAHCSFQPEAWHCAGSEAYLYGGTMASLIDCHSICTAVAEAYQREGRGVGEGETISYVTGELKVSYLRPTPISGPVELEARVESAGTKKSIVICTASVDGKVCASGRTIAIRVSANW